MGKSRARVALSLEPESAGVPLWRCGSAVNDQRKNSRSQSGETGYDRQKKSSGTRGKQRLVISGHEVFTHSF